MIFFNFFFLRSGDQDDRGWLRSWHGTRLVSSTAAILLRITNSFTFFSSRKEKKQQNNHSNHIAGGFKKYFSLFVCVFVCLSFFGFALWIRRGKGRKASWGPPASPVPTTNSLEADFIRFFLLLHTHKQIFFLLLKKKFPLQEIFFARSR